MPHPNPATDYFQQQDRFVADMIAAYKDGKLGGVYRPYIEWKTGGPMFSLEQGRAMMSAASNALDAMFDEPNADEELRDFLEAIDGEITNILPILK